MNRADVDKYVEELPIEEAFQPVQTALLRVGIKWLRMATQEERREFRGLRIEFDDDPNEPLVEGGVAPIRVTLVRRDAEETDETQRLLARLAYKGWVPSRWTCSYSPEGGWCWNLDMKLRGTEKLTLAWGVKSQEEALASCLRMVEGADPIVEGLQAVSGQTGAK